MSKSARTRLKHKDTPKLRPLRYERDEKPVYCELHGGKISVGDPVAWWPIQRGTRTMKTAYCSTCHWENVRAGRALQ
jgi:hypothetical protein